MKQPFKPGDRVRVYSDKFCGTTGIVKDGSGPFVIVSIPNIKPDKIIFHENQLRRLKPKAPKPVEAERLWVDVMAKDVMELFGRRKPNYRSIMCLSGGSGKEGPRDGYLRTYLVRPGEAIVSREKPKAPPAERVTAHALDGTKLVELRPGEVIVDRKKIADAWDSSVNEGYAAKKSDQSFSFTEMCRKLGLPPEGGTR